MWPGLPALRQVRPVLEPRRSPQRVMGRRNELTSGLCMCASSESPSRTARLPWHVFAGDSETVLETLLRAAEKLGRELSAKCADTGELMEWNCAFADISGLDTAKSRCEQLRSMRRAKRTYLQH